MSDSFISRPRMRCIFAKRPVRTGVLCSSSYKYFQYSDWVVTYCVAIFTYFQYSDWVATSARESLNPSSHIGPVYQQTDNLST